MNFLPTAFLATGLLLGCAGTKPPPSQLPSENLSATPEPEIAAPVPAPSGGKTPGDAGRTFSPPQGLDSLLDANLHALPAVKPAASAPGNATPKSADGKDMAAEGTAGVFQIQVDALSDMDKAQARKVVLEGKLGIKIEMVFDAPYYKLRFGSFATRREAEDKLVDLAGKNLQGFIVRQ